MTIKSQRKAVDPPPSDTLDAADEPPPGNTACLGDMLRSAVDWLWETDADQRLSYLSPGIGAFGDRPAALLIGQDFAELFEGDRASLGGILAAMSAQRPFRAVAVRLRQEDGSGRHCRVTGVPYFEPASGRFAGYRGTGTAQDEAPGQEPGGSRVASQLLKMLDAALARKDELEWEISRSGDEAFQSRLAGIAHELRTPLNAIIGFAEVIKDQHLGDDPVKYKDYARSIHESGLHLMDVVNDLIDLASIDAGKQSLESEQLDVADISASALRMLKDKARQASLTMVNELPEDLPKARGEQHALRQILLNLLSNAIKYSGPGGSIGLQARVDEPDVLWLTVWDTGVGIAPEDQERVFQRSYRVPQTELDRPGSGLGLAISRNLARAMGGDIVIASTPGQGTRVSVRLSIYAEPDPGDALS